MKCWNCGHDAAFVHEDADGEFWIECFDCGEHTKVYELEKDAWQEWKLKEARK